MGYQIWTLHPVKPRKGETKFKGQAVTYSRGEEGDAAADMRFARKMMTIMESEGATVLVAAVNGHPFHIGDADFLPRCAFTA